MAKKVFLILALGLVIIAFSYNVRQGDVLEIDVIGYPEISGERVVDVDGCISFPYIGRFKVVGMSIKQIQEYISGKLPESLKNFQVVVSLVKMAPRRIYVTGVINSVVDLGMKEVTLSRFISMIGTTAGSLMDEVDFSKVKVIRGDEVFEVDLSGLMKGVPPSNDLMLEEGDQILLPRKGPEDYVKILGAVQKPGIYEYQEGMTLLDIISRAGGLKATAGKKLEVLREKESLELQVDEIFEKPFELKMGDTVYVPEREERFAYIFGTVKNPGVYTFLDEEEMTLKGLIARAGGITRELKYIEKIVVTRSGTVVGSYEPEKLMETEMDIGLETGDIVDVRAYINCEVHVLGAVRKPGVFLVSPKESVDLKEILAEAGGLAMDIDEVESIVIMRNKEVVATLEPEKVLMGEISFEVLPGDVIQVREYTPRMAYITGYVKRPGLYTFGRKENFTLGNLITKAGGFLEERSVEKIVVTIEGKEEEYSVKDAMKHDIVLKQGCLVRVEPYEERYVYVYGLVNRPGYLIFAPDEKMTLGNVVAKAGGFTAEEKVREIRVLGREGKEIGRFTTGEVLSSTQELKSGSIVYVEPYEDMYAYVVGLVMKPGYVSFLPDEKMTLRKALAKAGGVPEFQIPMVKSITIVKMDGETLKLNPDEVLRNGKDVQIDKGDMIFVEKKEDRFIYVVGDNLARNGRMSFEPDETFTVSTAMKKYGVKDTALLKEVKLIRDGQEELLDPSKVLTSSRNLKNGDTLVVRMKKETVVYFTGDVTGSILFSPEESPTLDRAMAKLGKVRMDYLKSLKIIRRNGDVIQLKDVKPLELEDGDVIEVDLNEEVRVYVGGFVYRPGLVVFQPDEEPTLRKAITRIGGVREENEVMAKNIVLIRNGKKRIFDVKEVVSGDVDFILQDGDYINVTWKPLRYVFAFGEGVRNGKVIFREEEKFDVRTLLGKIGGLMEAASDEISIVYPDGEATVVRYEDVVTGGGPELETGAVVFVGEETEKFVYVLGEVRSPGAYRLKGEVNLLKALAMAGGLRDWASRTRIILRRNGRDLEIDASDLATMEGTAILPGDVVYVPAIDVNKVYVLGEVRNPGIVRIDMYSTVFDAIMKAGGFSQDAVYSKVFLFKGGLEGEVIVCDLAGVVEGKGVGLNPKLTPGDVIYVPRNPFISVTEAIPIIRDILSIIATAKSIAGL